jgi:hypothetical protein
VEPADPFDPCLHRVPFEPSVRETKPRPHFGEWPPGRDWTRMEKENRGRRLGRVSWFGCCRLTSRQLIFAIIYCDATHISLHCADSRRAFQNPGRMLIVTMQPRLLTFRHRELPLFASGRQPFHIFRAAVSHVQDLQVDEESQT